MTSANILTSFWVAAVWPGANLALAAQVIAAHWDCPEQQGLQQGELHLLA